MVLMATSLANGVVPWHTVIRRSEVRLPVLGGRGRRSLVTDQSSSSIASRESSSFGTKPRASLLALASAAEDHRRVLAVLTFLRA